MIHSKEYVANCFATTCLIYNVFIYLFILRYIADVLPGVAEVWQVISDRMEAVLISNPVNSVGDSFPGVRVGTAPHVVASLRLVARVGDAFFACFNSICCFEP